MDTTKLANAAQNMAQAGMEKTGPEFYAFMAVCLIIGLVGMVLWFQSKGVLKRAQEIPVPEAQKVQVVIDVESLKKAIQPIIDQLDVKLSAKIDSLEDRLESHTEREEDRFAAIEREVREGFRGVHSRIDGHIQVHGHVR